MLKKELVFVLCLAFTLLIMTSGALCNCDFPYNCDDINYIYGMIGTFGILSVSVKPDGLEIGLIDLSDERITQIKTEIAKEWINTDALDFCLAESEYIISQSYQRIFPYDCWEVDYLEDMLIGNYGIQSVSIVPEGLDIGLTDVTEQNIEQIKEIIQEEGISTEYIVFSYEAPFVNDPWMISDILSDMVGSYSIQSVSDLSGVFEIGLSDMSEENITHIKAEIERYGISTQIISFYFQEPIIHNEWYIDYTRDELEE